MTKKQAMQSAQAEQTCSYCGGPLNTEEDGRHWDSGRCAFHLKAKLAASRQREADLAAALKKYANAAKVSQPICTHAGVVSRDECPYCAAG
jgi:hypothetical protein